jgi:hypothetical protein
MSLFDFLPEIKRYRKYHIWVINTQKTCELYLWDNWRLFLPALNNLISLTSQPGFIRTFQSREYENKWLGFGRMKWNEANNIKWTTKYRNVDDITLQKIFFFNTQVWAPDWNAVC